MNLNESPLQDWLTMAGGSRTVRMAANIILVGTLAFIALLVPDLGGFGDYRLSAALILLPVSLCALILLRLDKPIEAYLVLLWGTLCAITISAVIVAGLRSAMVFAYPVVIMGAMPLGPRNVLQVAAVSILAVIGLTLAELFSLLPPARPSHSNFLALVYVFVLSMAALIAAAMVREQKRWRDNAAESAAALQSSEGRLREAQRIGNVGSWELNVASRRMTWSDELYKIYDRDKKECGGTWKDLLAMVHPDDVPLMRKAGYESAHATGNYEMRHRILTPSGRTKHIHVRFEVFRDDRGIPVRALGTAQDVTEQVLVRQEIERLNEQLEARVRERTAELQMANKELESFAYSISHDLRAPLRGIDGFGQLLLEEYGDQLDAQGQDYLKRMRSAAQRMGTLIDDILELSRVTRKAMGRETVDLSRMASDILENRMKSDPQRRVETAVAPGCVVTGDAQLLRILLENLFENAWKYTRTTLPARIEFCREESDGETVFVVRDNGVGFDMKYAGRLFGPFQRLHKPEEFEGTGIGLASAARVVHRHGGRIWADAELGRGATFRFTLSCGEAESPVRAEGTGAA